MDHLSGGTPAPGALDRVATVRARYPAAAAADYDDLVSPALTPATDELVRRLRLRPARLVVDVGTGTGRLVQRLRDAAPEAYVLGVDVSESMLAVATATHDVTVAAMDACRLGLRGGCADAVVLAFVLFLAPDPVAALTETRRVLRPGASVGVAAWGRKHEPAGRILAEVLDAAGVPDDPLPVERTDARMDTPGKLRVLLDEAGFGGCTSWAHLLERDLGIDRLLHTATRVGTPARRLATLDGERARQVVARARRRLSALPPDQRVHRAQVVLGTARRPA